MPAPYQTFSYNPSQSSSAIAGQNALNRWLNTQAQARGMHSQAEQPLQQNVQMFQPGGGYGQGQATLLQDQARQAQAEALSSQVASGMSSGSLATSTGLRVKKDLATGLKGVEDTRIQFLAQALQSLSGLRGQRSQTLATTSDPTYGARMANQQQQDANAAQQAIQVIKNNAAMQIAYMQTEAQKQTGGTGATGGGYGQFRR